MIAFFHKEIPSEKQLIYIKYSKRFKTSLSLPETVIYKKNTLESERKNNDIAEFYYSKRLNNTSELTTIYDLFSFDSSFSLRVSIFN